MAVTCDDLRIGSTVDAEFADGTSAKDLLVFAGQMQYDDDGNLLGDERTVFTAYGADLTTRSFELGDVVTVALSAVQRSTYEVFRQADRRAAA